MAAKTVVVAEIGGISEVGDETVEVEMKHSTEGDGENDDEMEEEPDCCQVMEEETDHRSQSQAVAEAAASEPSYVEQMREIL